jgi:hypothetical protein
VEREKDEDKNVEHGLSMEAQCPVRLLVFRIQEKGRKDLDTKKDYEGDAADPVKQPDKHQSLGNI